jgi:hypothetical protein
MSSQDHLSDRMVGIDAVWDLVRNEVERATAKFPPFNSSHEGYAVILEELDELWDEVKGNKIREAREEAVQVAAMAIRFLMDVTS